MKVGEIWKNRPHVPKDNIGYFIWDRIKIIKIVEESHKEWGDTTWIHVELYDCEFNPVYREGTTSHNQTLEAG